MLYELVIPLSLLVAPWLAVRFVFVMPQSQRFTYRQAAPYLLAASALWVMGTALPEIPLAGGATDTFVLHTIGGFVAATLFWLVVRAYRLRFAHWWQEPVSLFFFACGLGVVNELFEFLLFRAGLLLDNGSDTWWDLVATPAARRWRLGPYIWRASCAALANREASAYNTG